jgi:alpha-1,2-mannosyltransferase
MSYVWWALAVIVTAGLTVTASMSAQDATTRSPTPVPAVS